MNCNIKAFIILMFLSFIWINIQAMEKEPIIMSDSEDELSDFDNFSLDICEMSTQSLTIFQRINPFIYTADYLTQISSIHAINSTDQRLIKVLANLRICFNVVSIIKGLWYWSNPDITLNILEAKILRILNMIAKGYFVHKDSKISNNADAIALSNKLKNDKNLSNKKLCHYLWLTLNYFSAPFIQSIQGKESTLYYYAFLLSICSELYRQKLMYKMIENKQIAIK